MEIKEYVKERKEELKKEIEKEKRKPHLVIVKMNQDAASEAYVRGKVKDCNEVGILCDVLEVSLDTKENELLKIIDQLNHDDSVDGFIVQMPLPKHIHERKIAYAIDPRKDVDGFHPLSQFVPCTPKGVMDYLRYLDIAFKGKNAVVIGRSYIVGRPLAKLLLEADTNCVILHSRTSEEDKKFYIEHADLIFVAVGQKGILSSKYHYKEDAVIVDIGINRVDGKLYGDAEPNLNVKLQTPVPGGVGLLTRFSLLTNVWEAYKNGI